MDTIWEIAEILLDIIDTVADLGINRAIKRFRDKRKTHEADDERRDS